MQEGSVVQLASKFVAVTYHSLVADLLVTIQDIAEVNILLVFTGQEVAKLSLVRWLLCDLSGLVPTLFERLGLLKLTCGVGVSIAKLSGTTFC